MSITASRKDLIPMLPRMLTLALDLVPSSWKGRATLIAVLAIVGAVVANFISQSAADFYSSAREGILTNFGLGVVPVALLLLAFVWTLIERRQWLRPINFWVGAVAAVALILGVLAFFEAGSGTVAWFTLDGDVPLGGKVGDVIIGSATWQGVLSLTAIFLAGASITAPALAVDVASVAGRLSVHGYVVLVVAVRVVANWLSKIYRFDRGAGPDGHGGSTVDLESDPNMPPEVLSPYRRDRTPYQNEVETKLHGSTLQPTEVQPPAFTASMQETPEAPVLVEEETGEDEGLEGPLVAPVEPTVQDDDVAPAQPGTGKVNRYWDPSTEPAAQGELDLTSPDEDEPAMMARQWLRPSIDLLEDIPEGAFSEESMNETAQTIKRTLADYGVEVEIGTIKPGPTVTMYGLIPGWVRRYKQVKELDEEGRPKLDEHGRQVVSRVETKTRVRVDTILAREKDLSLALKTPSIRIETPVMGRAQVGIEVPNPDPSLVAVRSVMESPEFKQLLPKAHLPIALGKGSGGDTVVIDLAKMPHLLIAGATGSGKSVCINSIVSCLIMEKTPEEMRLLLIDPKRVEMTPYNGIPHLLTPVVVEVDQVVGLLKGLIQEMLDRYRRFEEVGVKNIETYNKRIPEMMPFLVVAIDELADLMMSAAFDVEQALCRLAQLGRATGIHLIVATQRPSVDVVTGLIKANFPSRISFGVTSQVDSRTILDSSGADKLLGRGDMLYLPLDASRPLRAQGVFISDKEIEKLVTFWKTTPRARIPTVRLRAVREDQGAEDDDEPDTGHIDELMDKAIALAQSYSKISTSLLQRRLRIGYPRAARLMDQLEEQQIVGPGDGSKSRDVIITNT